MGGAWDGQGSVGRPRSSGPTPVKAGRGRKRTREGEGADGSEDESDSEEEEEEEDLSMAEGSDEEEPQKPPRKKPGPKPKSVPRSAPPASRTAGVVHSGSMMDLMTGGARPRQTDAFGMPLAAASGHGVGLKVELPSEDGAAQGGGGYTGFLARTSPRFATAVGLARSVLASTGSALFQPLAALTRNLNPFQSQVGSRNSARIFTRGPTIMAPMLTPAASPHRRQSSGDLQLRSNSQSVLDLNSHPPPGSSRLGALSSGGRRRNNSLEGGEELIGGGRNGSTNSQDSLLLTVPSSHLQQQNEGFIFGGGGMARGRSNDAPFGVGGLRDSSRLGRMPKTPGIPLIGAQAQEAGAALDSSYPSRCLLTRALCVFAAARQASAAKEKSLSPTKRTMSLSISIPPPPEPPAALPPNMFKIQVHKVGRVPLDTR